MRNNKQEVVPIELFIRDLVISMIICVPLILFAAYLSSSGENTAKPCVYRVYESAGEYHVTTTCGHIVEDRCPFCDNSVVIEVE